MPRAPGVLAWYLSGVDPLAGSQWSASDTVAGFAKSAPNAVLMTFAKEELRRPGHSRALDLGCGAGRNALPIAQLGWKVVGVDLSWPMLVAAATRVRLDRGRYEVRLCSTAPRTRCARRTLKVSRRSATRLPRLEGAGGKTEHKWLVRFSDEMPVKIDIRAFAPALHGASTSIEIK